MSKPPTPLPRTRLQENNHVWTENSKGFGHQNNRPFKQPPPVAPKPKNVILSPTVGPSGGCVPTEERNQTTVENSKGFDHPFKQPPPVSPRTKGVTISPTMGPHGGCDTLDCSSPVKSPPVLPQKHRANTLLNTMDQHQVTLYQEVLPGDKVAEVAKNLSSSQNLHTDNPSNNIMGFTSNKKTDRNYEDIDGLMEWWKTVEPCNLPLRCRSMEDEVKAFNDKAYRVKNALRVFTHLLTERGETLNNYITELHSIADNLDKVFKGAKIAGITGGATGAVGGVAAVAGVILAPVTMGASLLVTVAGVGAVAAGGVTGASAAITNKVCNSMDRKKVEKILKDYMDQIADINECLKFISTGLEELKQHDLSRLNGVDTEAVKVARVAETAGSSSSAIQAVSMSCGVLQGFAVGMEFYFAEGDAKKLKKGTEAKFAKKIRNVTKELRAGLNELIRVKTMLSTEGDSA